MAWNLWSHILNPLSGTQYHSRGTFIPCKRWDLAQDGCPYVTAIGHGIFSLWDSIRKWDMNQIFWVAWSSKSIVNFLFNEINWITRDWMFVTGWTRRLASRFREAGLAMECESGKVSRENCWLGSLHWELKIWFIWCGGRQWIPWQQGGCRLGNLHSENMQSRHDLVVLLSLNRVILWFIGTFCQEIVPFVFYT